MATTQGRAADSAAYRLSAGPAEAAALCLATSTRYSWAMFLGSVTAGSPWNSPRAAVGTAIRFSLVTCGGMAHSGAMMSMPAETMSLDLERHVLGPAGEQRDEVADVADELEVADDGLGVVRIVLGGEVEGLEAGVLDVLHAVEGLATAMEDHGRVDLGCDLLVDRHQKIPVGLGADQIAGGVVSQADGVAPASIWALANSMEAGIRRSRHACT